MKEPKVGERYYLAPLYAGSDKPRYITVTKVGRKYFYSETLKFDKETFEHLDDIWPRYRLYDTEEDCLIETKAKCCWSLITSGLYRKMSYQEIIELYNKLETR